MKLLWTVDVVGCAQQCHFAQLHNLLLISENLNFQINLEGSFLPLEVCLYLLSPFLIENSWGVMALIKAASSN